MLTGILIIAVFGLLGVLSHRRSRLEKRIYKNVPLSEWLIVFILPIVLYLGWFFIVKNILNRPKLDIFFLEDFDILAITILFMVYGFVGNAIHFTGKILWRYLSPRKHSTAYFINEMFHGKLSHYLVYLNGIFIFFLLILLEINHPQVYPVDELVVYLIMIGGIVFGLSVTKSIFFINAWFGGYNKPLFFISTILLIAILVTLKIFNMKLIFYPVSLFIFTIFMSSLTTFIIRQIFIFSRLGNKRRLHFLAKILSI